MNHQLKQNCYLNPEQDKNIKCYSANVDVGQLCANLHYTLILPFDYLGSFDQENNDIIPYVVTYQSETTRIFQIIKDLVEQDGAFQGKHINLTLKSGHIIPPSHSMRDLKKELCRENIDGLQLFISITHPDFVDSDEDIYIDESCLTAYLLNQTESGSLKQYMITIEIPLKDRKEIMPLRISTDIDGRQLVEQILKKIKLDYGITLKENDIKDIIITQKKRPLIKDQGILHQVIYDKSVLTLNLVNSNTKLKRISTKNYNISLTIYKEKEQKPQEFHYSQISHLTFDQLYRNRLQLEESKNKKQAIYCLKISDVIIRPDELLSKAQQFFETYANDPLKVVGKVVNQKEIFYHHIPKLIQTRQQFSIERLKMPTSEIKKRDDCRKTSKDRAVGCKNIYFNKYQNIEPIMIYTAELRYIQSPNNHPTIYGSLNEHLRNVPILTLDEEYIQAEWRYIYASTLLKHLQKIEKYHGKVYRGVTYDPKCKEDDILTFKSFLSTSSNRNAAIKFATKDKEKTKKKFFFEMEILEGYPIKEYSVFMSEDEILLEPFTEFRVKKVENKNIEGFKFQIMQLTQIPTSKVLPAVVDNLIVWIDPNTKEARQIFDNLQNKENTMLKHILSTDELKVWLKQNDYMMKDPSMRVIFMTNMSRKEGEVWNGIAGIEGLRQIRKYHQTIPVFFYIGNISNTKDKFIQCKENPAGVPMGVKAEDAKKFLMSQMKLI